MWCPKCKNEYIEGITTCAECDLPLVEELTEENTAPYVGEDSGTTFQSCSIEGSAPTAHAYIKKEAAYEDTKSTAFTFLFIGLLGIVFLVLLALDVIHLGMESHMRIMMFLVMGALFLFFVGIGIRYQLLLSSVKQELQEEEDSNESILTWFFDTYTAASIDSMLNSHAEDEEQLYFLRYEILQKLLKEQYPALEESYADHILEEIYSRLYETEKE